MLLPAGNYAVAYCPSFTDELKVLPHFTQALTQAGYTPVGDYICEVIRVNATTPGAAPRYVHPDAKFG